ncbi:hypothetical protein ACI2IX_17770 [Leifsonia aquatica]|uniref:hypothetical protein n=1 Tax=Leifsonia aquatica TaxID=144185 RepID=UPI00384EE4CB
MNGSPTSLSAASRARSSGGDAQAYRGGQRDWIKVKHRDTLEVIAGAVTGTLTPPGDLILGRYDRDGLDIIGRTAPISRGGMPDPSLPYCTPAARITRAHRHPLWRVRPIRAQARDHRDAHRTLTVEISADTAVVAGSISRAARYIRARTKIAPTTW